MQRFTAIIIVTT